jgi:hypothetical protein
MTRAAISLGDRLAGGLDFEAATPLGLSAGQRG